MIHCKCGRWELPNACMVAKTSDLPASPNHITSSMHQRGYVAVLQCPHCFAAVLMALPEEKTNIPQDTMLNIDLVVDKDVKN